METQDKEKLSKNTTQYMLVTTAQTNKNNINKTWALLQTTGGKDEPKKGFYKILKMSNPLYAY